MRSFFKQCKNTKQVNHFLESIGLSDFSFDPSFKFDVEFDLDQWIDAGEINGVAIQVNVGLEVHVTKYSNKDIEKLERFLQ